MNTYNISYWVKENQPMIKGRKFLELFKKPELIDNYIWVRKSANFNCENDIEILKVFDSNIFRDFIKQTNKDVNSFQLEEFNISKSNYIRANN